MNKITLQYVERAVNIAEKLPTITKIVVVGSANNDNFAFEDRIKLAVYTKPDANIAKTCVDLNTLFGENELNNIDIYMMADEDFYVEVASLINDGSVMLER